ncbi:hypothetical protein PR202_ga27519 [Eleusine coracana subsp. coracana]|uniref:Uncharacterized protein n=1 Tax=Eleusine coracana subsp. coracana TaxID=191504 RepID=A0AAV5DH20_ELECO|nr:hypothetical protein PR202_ga27519 [Eleusine coracana subsp. coracana]
MTSSEMSETIVPQLPDDVITDILERLVADPVFLRCRWPDTSSSALIGFFVQRHQTNFSTQRDISLSRAPVFIPAPDSVLLGPCYRSLTSLVRDDGKILDKAKPLVARGGLLLVDIAPRSSEKNNIRLLCVCNMLTGRRERLPTLNAFLLDDEGVGGYGLVTAADYHDNAGKHSLPTGAWLLQLVPGAHRRFGARRGLLHLQILLQCCWVRALVHSPLVAATQRC